MAFHSFCHLSNTSQLQGDFCLWHGMWRRAFESFLANRALLFLKVVFTSQASTLEVFVLVLYSWTMCVLDGQSFCFVLKARFIFCGCLKRICLWSGSYTSLKITKVEKTPSRADCIRQVYWDVCVSVLHFDRIWCEKEDLSKNCWNSQSSWNNQ